MKRYLGLTVVVVSLLYWWTQTRGKFPQTSLPAEALKEPKLAATPPPLPMAAPSRESKRIAAPGGGGPVQVRRQDVSPLMPQAPQQPPPGTLEFEIHEGVAVTQGDMVLGRLPEGQNLAKGLAEARPTRLWPSHEIPYSIQEGVAQRDAIQNAIAVFNRLTPVRFVPFQGQTDSLVFVPSKELCASYLGRTGGAQPIFLSPACGVNEIVHELMHALGFVHEHSRPDRDRHLEVLWSNIDPKFWPQFWIIPDELIHDYIGSVFSFDPESVMLYDANAFAKAPEMVTLRPRSGADLKPARGTLSRVDQERVGYLYGK